MKNYLAFLTYKKRKVCQDGHLTIDEKMKKNVWIISHYAGGPSYCPRIPDYLLAKYLQDHGYGVVVIASSYVHNTDINFISDRKKILNKIIDDVPFIFVRTRNYVGKVARVYNMLEFYFRLMFNYKTIGTPDLVMAAMPTPTNCLAGEKIAKHFKVPYITSIVDLWPLSIVEYAGFSNKNLLIQFLYRFEKWLYIRSDELVFTWEGAYDYIIDKGWDKEVSREKFHYINIGVDLKAFNYNKEKYMINDEDLNDQSFKVMYCGSIREANDIGTVVESAAILMKRGYAGKIKFIIYGDGPDKAILERKCKEEGITNVVFKGAIEKKYIPFVLSKSNLNILNLKPSSTQKYGNSSNKLFEYMAAGNPVIANIDEGKYPIISKYNVGKIVRAANSKDYADGIEYFYDLPINEIEGYQKRALETVKIFDAEQLNCEWERIIKSRI